MKKIVAVVCTMILLFGMNPVAYAAAKDTKAPTITKTSPVDKATDIMSECEIVIRFSENIKKGKTISQISIQSLLGKDVTYTYEIKENLLVITPKAKLALNTNYTVIIPSGAVKDIAGNVLKKERSFEFITEESTKMQSEEAVEGITYDIGLEATLQGEFTPTLQLFFIQYIKQFGIEAKITKVEKVGIQ